MNILLIKEKDGSFTLNGDGNRVALTLEQAVALRDLLIVKLKKIKAT